MLINRDMLGALDVTFICVTDNPEVQSEDYEIRVVRNKYSDITKNARYVKVNGFDGMADYDVAIWHDSSVQLHCDKISKLASFAQKDMMTVFHHVRYCAYMEAIACIEQKKDAPLRILAQMYKYYKEGLPTKYKLHETTIMVLNCKTYLNSELRSIWWEEIEKRSRRDQLSLAYARWKTGIDPGLLAHWTATGAKNEYSTWVGHKHDRYDHANPLLSLNSYLIRGISKKLLYEMRRRR